ncbi:MAG: hypothetical protein EA421_09990 [Gemmatimonadales bacterium]|nr:MAG: hypothetical protein EA421_09990 [Gemmatimonadales bacterium]
MAEAPGTGPLGAFMARINRAVEEARANALEGSLRTPVPPESVASESSDPSDPSTSKRRPIGFGLSGPDPELEAPDPAPPTPMPQVPDASPHPGRPFYNHSVDEMEEFWEDCDQDLDIAEELLEELTYRTSARARTFEWWLRQQL